MPKVLEEDFRSVNPQLLNAVADRTIAISGATGFIGSLLARYLLWANDYYGIGVKLVLCSRSPNRLETTLPGVSRSKNIRFIPADFTRPCEPLEARFDFLVHTAAITQSSLMRQCPADVLRVGLTGIMWALDSARQYDARVLNLSSMEAVGTIAESTVIDEERLGQIDLGSIRSCYPESKRVGELACLCWSSQYGIDALTARLAQTFGAGVNPNDGRVFMQFARSSIYNQPIVLHTDGMGEGNYVYSSDALAAILTLLAKGKAGETYNVANEACHTTIRDMAEMVASRFGGVNCKVVFDIRNPNQTGYAAPTHMILSSAKLQSLGWKPEIGLEVAYQRLIRWLQEYASLDTE